MFAVSLSEMEWIAEAMVSNDECEGAPVFSLWTHIRADCSSAHEAHALYSRRGQKVERCSSRQFQPRCSRRRLSQQGKEMIVGIDIGVAGAIAILDWSGALHEIHDMPTQKLPPDEPVALVPKSRELPEAEAEHFEHLLGRLNSLSSS